MTPDRRRLVTLSGGIAEAIGPDTGLVMVETPASPALADIGIRARALLRLRSAVGRP